MSWFHTPTISERISNWISNNPIKSVIGAGVVGGAVTYGTQNYIIPKIWDDEKPASRSSNNADIEQLEQRLSNLEHNVLMLCNALTPVQPAQQPVQQPVQSVQQPVQQPVQSV